jgi:hypothetical protein
LVSSTGGSHQAERAKWQEENLTELFVDECTAMFADLIEIWLGAGAFVLRNTHLVAGPDSAS